MLSAPVLRQRTGAGCFVAPASPSSSSTRLPGKLVGTIVFVFLLMILVALLLYRRSQRRKKIKLMSRASQGSLEWDISSVDIASGRDFGPPGLTWNTLSPTRPPQPNVPSSESKKIQSLGVAMQLQVPAPALQAGQRSPTSLSIRSFRSSEGGSTRRQRAPSTNV